jgi:hypothetical protein
MTIIFIRARTFFGMLFNEVESGFFYFWVYGKGNNQDLQKFGFRIKFHGSEEAASYAGPVVSIDNPARDVIEDKIGLIMRDSFIRRIRNGQEVSYDLEIFEQP